MHLFTYGTLMFPEVWQAVVGREFETLPATLPNYQIFRVRDAVFPGIIAIQDPPLTPDRSLPAAAGPPTSVSGLLYINVDHTSIERLDRFEDDFYRRQTITVTCRDGQELSAEAYIVPQESRHVLTDELWTAEDFAARGHLAEFVSRYSGFKRLG